MKFIYQGVVILMLFFLACTPKTVAPIQQEVVEEVKPAENVNTNCLKLSDLSSSDRDKAETAFVLYRDFLKAEDYKQAFSYWSTAYDLAPAANGSIQYHYDDGVKIYRDQYSKVTDDASKDAIVSKVRALYEKRRECFGDEAYLKGREGFDLYYYFPGEVSDDEVFALFKDVLDAKGDKSDYFIMNPMAKILSDKAIEGDITPAEAGKYASIMLAAIKKGSTNCTKDCESWKAVESYAPARLENLEGIKGLYECSYYADKYYPMFQADPTSCETINLTYGRMKWGGCDDSNPMLKEIASAKATHCKPKVVATAPGPLKQAFNLYESGQYTEAVTAFEDFADSTTDVDKKAKYYLLVAKIYYRDIKKYSKARTFAEKAASVKPNWGEPYMLIGKLYASSGPLCGPGTGFDSQVVTWPAIDMFKKAKQVDSSVAADANKLIATYQQYMPSREDIFSRSIKEGDTFKVKCWINRNTVVRTAN
jgi:tetratricopeptide (TPR) repeat protein